MRATNEAKAMERGDLAAGVQVLPVTEERKLYLVLKRSLDISLSLLGLLLCLPLFVVVSVWIKLEDPRGSVLFKQIRVGKGGRQFYMYKFRSMVSNAESMLEQLLDQNEVSGLMFKMKDDPRITKVGKFIRKTSIDELPQLLNVLKGEMSLVGPRPPLPREVSEYNSYHMQRLSVTPGCTGLWQATARNSVGFEEMVELDLQYIAKQSILFDIKLIFRTVSLLLGSKNAF